MELISLALSGGPAQIMVSDQSAVTGPHGVLGVDVASRTIDGHHWTVVQLLLDDDHPLFDRELLDAPVVAEVRTHGHADCGGPVALPRARALRPRRLPPPAPGRTGRRRVHDPGRPRPYRWRAAAALRAPRVPPDRAGPDRRSDLIVRRTTVAELVAGVEAAYAKGDITDDDRRALLITIEQRHPTPAA